MIFYIILFLLEILPLSSEEIKITSELNKDKIKMGEEFILTVTISGNYSSSPQIKLPDLSNFITLSSQQYSTYNIKKGRYEAHTKYEIHLLPKKVGIFNIGPVELNYKNRIYKTETLTIEVLPSELEEIPALPWKSKRGKII